MAKEHAAQATAAAKGGVAATAAAAGVLADEALAQAKVRPDCPFTPQPASPTAFLPC